jgi:NAD+ synthase (glutamine-hydrolysing)
MYGVNASVPKTLIRHTVAWVAEFQSNEEIRLILSNILSTPISPELLPSHPSGEIAQKTEDIIGSYELHDFFLYHFIRSGCSAAKILFLAEQAFDGKYDRAEILRRLTLFFERFFSQQFKRSAMPDSPTVGEISLSPRGGLNMPSDASAAIWIKELKTL